MAAPITNKAQLQEEIRQQWMRGFDDHLEHRAVLDFMAENAGGTDARYATVLETIDFTESITFGSPEEPITDATITFVVDEALAIPQAEIIIYHQATVKPIYDYTGVVIEELTDNYIETDSPGTINKIVWAYTGGGHGLLQYLRPPLEFSGDYNDLINKPTLVTTHLALTDTPSYVAKALQATNLAGTALENTSLFYDAVNVRFGINQATPLAKIDVKGSGTTSATMPARFVNGAVSPVPILTLFDSGGVLIGGGTMTFPTLDKLQINDAAGARLFHVTNAGITFIKEELKNSGAINLSLTGNPGHVFTINNAGTGESTFNNNALSVFYTGNTKNWINFANDYVALAGSSNLTINALNLKNITNLTNSTGTNIFRSIYINPTLTGSMSHRAIESVVGGAYFNTTSVQDSAILQADSTTRGFLPPRMTGTQTEAIVTPATGLLVYATSAGAGDVTDTGWWGYNGTNWVKLN